MKRLIAMVLACVLATFASPFSSAAVAPVHRAPAETRAAAGACAAKTSGYNQCQVFRSTGSLQTFTPPAVATAVRFHLWGGGGGNGTGATSGWGGGGGYTLGSVSAPLAASYSINVPAGGGGVSNAGGGGGAAWVKDASGALLLVAGGGGGGGRGVTGFVAGDGGAGGGANGATGGDGAGGVKGGAGAAGAVGGAAGNAGTRAGKAGGAAPLGAGGAGGTDGSVGTSSAGGGGGAGYAGGAGGDGAIVTQAGGGGGGGSGFVDTTKVPDGTTTAGSGKTPAGTDDPFYDGDKYGDPKTAGAVVVEWAIPAVQITSPGDGDTIGTDTEFTGTGAPGATVTLTRGTSTSAIGTATVGADGRWTIVANGQSTSATPVVYKASQTLTSGQTPVTNSISVTVVSTGLIDKGKPVTRISNALAGRCQADYNGTSQFWSGGSGPSCSSALSIGTSLVSGGWFNGASSLTGVSQTPTTGTGSASDPYSMTTVYSAGSGMRLSQEDSYVNGQNGFRVDVTVVNTGTTARTGTYYRGGDCLLAGVDQSYGAVLPAAPGMGNGIACVKNSDGTGQAMMLVPLTAGSTYAEGTPTNVRDQASGGKPMQNTCRCTENLDSAMGLSWPYSLAPGESKTFSFVTYFRPADVKAMTAEKTVSPGKVKPGDTVTYTVKFTNPNTYPVTTFGFTDTLDARLDYVAGSTSGTDLNEPVVNGSQVGWGTFTTLAAGASYTFTFQAKVKTTATLGTATNDFSGDGITTLSKVAPLLIAPPANLTVTKTVDRTAVLIGGQVVFTVTVKNDGPNAAANVVLTDQLPTGLTWVSDDSAGKYDRTTGKWTVGALAKDATATLKITARAAQEGDFLNAVTAVTSDTTNGTVLCTDASTPSTCPSARVTARSSDLVMTAATSPNPVVPGGATTATLTVTNNGPSTTGSAATVTFTLPQRTTLGAPLPAGCTAAADGRSVSCTVATGLAKDAKAVFAVPLVVDSGAPLATALTGGSAVVALTDDPNTANNTAAVPLTTAAKGSNDLAIAATSPSAPVTPGTAGTVTGTVTNGGPSDTTTASTVTFTLPARTTAAATQPAGCTVAADRRSVTCTIAAGLKNGATASFAVSVVVDPDAPLGTVLSGGTAAVANAEDPVATNNSAAFTVTTAATGSADVSITKKAAGSALVPPGGTFVYDIVVTNAGPSQATDVVVTDTLPAALKFVSADSGCTASGQVVTCPAIATLNPGAKGTVKVTVQLDPAYAGDGKDVRNQAVVKSATADPDQSNNTSDASTGGLPGPGPGPNPPAPVKADVAIVKKPVGAGAVAPGESFDYTVTVTNNGPSDAAGLVVSDALPAVLKFVSASDGCTASGQQVTCPKVATLAAKASRTFTIKVQLDPAYTGDGSDVRNQAKVATDSADPDLSNNTSDGSTGTLPGPDPGPYPPARVKADVAITKKATATALVAAGESFDYTVTVTNNGPSDAAGLVVSDALPAVLKFVSASDGCTASGQQVTCPKVATLAAKASKTYTVTVQLDPAYAGDGKDVRNQAKVVTDSADPDLSNNTSDASTGGLPGPGPGPNPPAPVKADVAITKKPASATLVSAGESFDYTVTVTNNGPSDATGVVVSDALPSMVKFVSASDGCTASGQQVTCPKVATLAAKASKTYTVTVQLDPAYAGDGKDVRNQAKVVTDSADPDTSNNTSDASTGGLPGPGPGPNPPAPVKADVAITKKATSTTLVAPGESFDYTVTVTNNGPSDAAGLVVTDALPSMVKFVSASDGCTASGQDVTCPKVATLAAKSSRTFTIKVQLDPAYAGDGKDVRNQAKVATESPDPDSSNNTSDASTGGLPGPGPGPNPPAPVKADVAITKKATSTALVSAGESFDYTVTVTNNGPSQASGLVVTDSLPAVLKFVSASDGCSASGQDVTCPKLATLAVGSSKTYTVKVQLDPAYAGDGKDVRNQAKVASDSADPDTSNNTSDASTGGLPGPGPGPNPPAPVKADVAITKKATSTTLVSAGESFDYTVTVTNNGPSQASGLVVTDSLPAVLKFVSASDGCTASGQDVTCPKVATLAAKASRTFTVKVQLDPVYSGDGKDVRNQAKVASDSADPDLSNNTSDASTGGLPGPGPGPNPPAPVKADVAITKKPASAAPVAPGETFDYTVTVTNNGPSQASGLVVTDSLPAVLKFVSASDGCTASGQEVTCPKQATLAVGASKSYTVKVQLDPAYSGDGSDVRNRAKVATESPDPDTSNNTSDGATGTLPGPGPNPPAPVKADVAITKKAAGTTLVAPGESFDYAITVTNNGPSQASGVVVSDALPSMVKFVSASDGCTASGQDVTCPKLATLAVGASKTYNVKVQLDPAYAGDGKDVRNQAKVATDSPDPDSSNNTSDASTGGLPGPGPGPNPPAPVKADVAISKKPAAATPVAPGETFDYTVTVTNNGPSQASGLVVSDALPSMLKFVSASDGCTASGQDVTCPKLATLAVSTSKSYTIKVQLDPAYSGDGSDVRNQAKVATESPDPDPSNNTSDASTGGLPGPGPGPNPPAPVKADVAITKKPASAAPVAPGETFDYMVTVTNNGPSQASGLVVTDSLPAVLKFVSASDGCTASGQEVTCPKVAALAAKASKSYTLKVQLDPAYSGDGTDVRNQAKVATDSADPDLSNNTSDGSTGTLPGPDPGPYPPAPVKADVAITKKATATALVAPGESFDYAVTVTNDGPSDALGVVVSDALPSMLKFVSASDGCTASGQQVMCPKVATLAAKTSKTYTVTVQLDPAYSGDGKDVRNQAKVASDSADPDLSNNTSDASTGGLPGPGPGPNPPAPVKADVAITKKPASAAPVAPGETFDYTVTVTNNGPSQASGLVVTDSLPAVLKFVSASDGCTASGQEVTCPKLATLAVGASKSYTVKVQLDPAYSGDGSDVRNRAKVATESPDPDTSNNTSDGATGTLPGPGPNPPAPVKADVAITKKAAGTTLVAPGESFDYTVTVTNNGPSQASGLTVTDALPLMVKFVSASDGCTASGQQVTCPKADTLAVGASKSYTVKVQLDPVYSGDGSDVRNQAKVATESPDPDPSNNTSDASTGGLPGPGPGPNPPAPVKADVAITKKPASASPVAPGETFDYTITVTNKGPSQASGLVVTDSLPAALKFVSASDGCSASGQDVTCPKLATLAVGASKSYTVKVQLDPAYSGDGTDVRNQAKVATESPDPDTSNNTSDGATGTLPGPGPNPPAPVKADVAITKRPVGSAQVAPGETFDYAVTVTNNGPSDAAGVVVSDALPSMVKFVSASDGCTASGQQVTCPKVPTLAAKASRTFTIRVQLDPAYSGDGKDVRNQASVASDSADPDLSNNTSDASTGGLPGPGPGPNPPAPVKADVAIAKKPASNAPVAPGETFDYAITVTNNGPSQASGLVVTDALPAALKFVSASDGCTSSGQQVTCPKLETLAAKVSKTYTVKVQLDPAYSGDGSDVRNQAKVTTDSADPDTSNNTSDGATGTLPGPDPGPYPPAPVKADVAITKKAAGTTLVAPGESFDYAITVTNNGPSQASGVVVSDALPSMLKFVSASDGCTATGQQVTCPKLATLAVGSSKTFTVKVQLDPAYAGDGKDVRNQAKVATESPDPDSSNNTSDASTGGLPGPGPGPNPPAPVKADAAITKKPAAATPVAPGETFDYTVTVTNNGPSQASGLVVTDSLPAVLKFVSASDGCTASGQDVTCPKLATLAVGASKTYTVKVQLDPAYSGDGTDVRNQAKVATESPDPDPSNNTSDGATGTLPGPGPNPPAPVKADVAITKRPVGSAQVAPGETFDYAVTVTNNGPSDAAGVVVSDALPAVLKFVSASDGCTASGQDVTCPKVATLAAKASRTFTVKVQLDPAYAGDGKDVRNQAKVASDSADPDTSNNTSDASTGGLPGPGPGPNPPAPVKADVAITKKATSNTLVAPGETFDYAITVTNNGPSLASGVVVSDALPSMLKFVSTSDGCSLSGQDVTCPKLATLAVGTSKTYTVKVQLDPAYAGDGKDVRNQAKAATDSPDPDSSNNTSDASTGGLPGPGPGPNPPAPVKADVAITKKAAGATPVAPGETFDYAITVTNNGPSQASGVVVSDALPSMLKFVSASDGCTASGQDVTCPKLATLAVGASKSYTVRVQLDPAYSGDGTDVRNQAKVATDSPDPDTSNNTSDASTGGLPGPGPGPNPPAPVKADVAIAKKATATALVAAGESFDYTVTVTNNGPSQASGLVMTDSLPSMVKFVSASDGCTVSGQDVTCPRLATLAVGSSKTYTVRVQLDPAYSGDGTDVRNQAKVGTDSPDPDQSNNTSDASTGGLPGPGPGPNPPAPVKADVAITKKPVGSSSVAPGESFGYEITVRNDGPSDASGLVVSDALPSMLKFVSASDGCTASGQQVTCPKLVKLAAKASRTYTVAVQLDPAYSADGKDVRNQAKVSTDTADPDLSNNTSDASTGGLPGPGPGPNPPAPVKADVAITKKPASATPVAPGEIFDYTVTVTNNGPSQASGLVVTDSLPAALKFVSASDGCTASGQEVTCPKAPVLAVGASKSYTLKVQLDPAYSGDGTDVRNQAKAATDSPDPDTSNNTSDGSTGTLPGPGPNPPAPVKADVAITKKPVGTGLVAPGETFDYAITVTNNGPSQASGLVVTDSLPAVLKFVAASDGCTASGQEVTCPKVATLAVGASKTYTVKVQLDPAYSGDGSDVRNQAKVGTDSPDPDPSNNTSDAATGTLPGPGPGPNPPAPAKADVAVTKKPVGSAPVAPGETFDYAITVTNAGPSRAMDVRTTDALPAPLAFVSSSDGCTAAGQDVTCPTLPTLAVNGTRTFTFTVRLDQDYEGNGSDIGNIAKVTAGTADPELANNSSAAAGLPGGKPRRGEADLAVDKSAGGSAVVPGETVDYTITVTNNGPSSDGYNVVLTDRLPAALTYVSSQPAGCTVEATTRTVTCPARGRLKVGQKMTYVLTARLDASYRGDGTDVVNRAVVHADNIDPNSANDGDDAPLPDNGRPAPPKRDMAARVTLSQETVVPGETVKLIARITNNGPSTHHGEATFTVTLPEELSFARALPGHCTAVGAKRAVCKLPAGLLPKPRNGAGDPAVGVLETEFEVRVSPEAQAGRTLTERVRVTDPADGLAENDEDVYALRVGTPVADLALTKSAAYPVGKDRVDAGDTFTYTVTTTNNGPSTAMGVRVTDPLPAELAFVSSPDGCGADGRTVRCGPVARLAPGEKAVHRVLVTLSPRYAGNGRDVDNIATTGSETFDPRPADNSNKLGTNGPDGGPLRTVPAPLPPGPTPKPKPGPLPDTGTAVAAATTAATLLLLLGLACTAVVRRRSRRAGE
ncbi:isopeptide-forming domain-containing fimbrial protein [Kitasatospora sp. NPDC001664]